MMIFCCMPPEKFSRFVGEPVEPADRAARSRSRDLAVEPAVAEAEAAMRAEMAEQQVLAHRQVRHDALAPAVLGDKADAGADRLRRRARRERLAPRTEHRPPRAWAQAEDGLHRLGPSGADQAAKAEDLAAMQIERDVAHQRRRVEAAHGQNGFAARFSDARDASRVR